MAGQRMVGDYVLMQQIGSGSFAVVWKAKHRHTGSEVAIKEIAVEKLNKKLSENLMSEIHILKKTNHPNIIRLYDTIPAPNRIYLVLEFCAGGDLAAYIQLHGRVSEAIARHFMRQLGAGLQVLRANNLIHRDLKPQNLLLSTSDNNAVLKIADFGFARSLQPQGMAETLCGSPLYMAPEILDSKKYDAKADLWSVGTILYQLVTGQPPFLGQSPFQLLQNIQKSNDLRFPTLILAELHPECIDLCRKLLRKDPVERLSFEEFFNHSFIAQPIRREPAGHPSLEGKLSSFGATKSFQDEAMPFLLDEDPQFVSASPTTSTTITRQQVSPFSFMRSSGGRTSSESSSGRKDIFINEKGGSTRVTGRDAHNNIHFFDTNLKLSKPIAIEGASLGPESEQGSFQTSHSKGAMMDSMEFLEKEYVLVSVPVTSTDAVSLSASDQSTGLGHQLSPCKNAHKISAVNPPFPKKPAASLGVVNSTDGPETSHCLLESVDVAAAASSLVHLPTRLHALQKYAETIADLANDKYLAGLYLEAFSTQLVCLAVWKEALNSFGKGADSSSGPHARVESEGSKLSLPFVDAASDDKCGAEAVCSGIEQNFVSAVKQAEGFAPHLYSIDGNTEIPDAMEIIFQAALTTGRNAAVDELMGNSANAAMAYTKAATLLYFLLVEATSLPVTPRLVLGQSDKQRLHNYIEMLATRQSLCASQKINLHHQYQEG